MKKRRSPSKPPSPAAKKDAQLCIQTSVGGFSNTPFLEGHTWLKLDQGDKSTTFDTTPEGRTQPTAAAEGSDLRVNGGIAHPALTSYCRPVSDGQIEQLMKQTRKPVEWSKTHNCTSWATDTFNGVTGAELDADDGWAFGAETPRALADDIAELRERETGEPSARRAEEPSTGDRMSRMVDDALTAADWFAQDGAAKLR